MKKLIILLSCGVCVFGASSQTTGTVTYLEKMKLELKFDGPDSAMLAGIPREHSLKKTLYFTPGMSLYQNEEGNEESQDVDKESENGARMVIRMEKPDDKAFCDLKNNKRIEQRDFMSRKFLIETDLNKMEWKLTGNQKMILDRPCLEAVLKDTGKYVTAWFASSIPVSTGPQGYANLPGLILEIDIDHGKRTITATKIDLKEFDHAILARPDKGKKVTKEQFNRMVEEKQKEMREENGGEGDVIIKIRH